MKNPQFAKTVKMCYNTTCRTKKESVYYFKKKDKILYERNLQTFKHNGNCIRVNNSDYFIEI